MSIRLMSQVWDLDLPDSDKLVLLALADNANDDGVCWPSVATIAKKCSKSEATVSRCIRSLKDAGHLSITERSGKSNIWHVCPAPSPIVTPVTVTGGHGDTPPPPMVTPKPTRTSITRKATLSSGERAKSKTMLPEDWRLPDRAELPPKARALAEQWTLAAYETHGEAFTSYWRGRNKMMADWRLTWANRIVDIHSKVMRDEKFGNGPKAVAPRPPAEPIPIEKQIERLDERASFFRRVGQDGEADKFAEQARRLRKPMAIGDLVQRVAAGGRA